MDYVTDDLVHLDVQSTALDATFFPFEEVLDQLLLLFSRDKWVAQHAATATATDTAIAQFPPSGVAPFRGLVFYAAPFSYLYEPIDEMYFGFRALYCRYLCRLQHISSDPRDILTLTKQFEDLLIEVDPNLFWHLNSIRVSLHSRGPSLEGPFTMRVRVSP
eukprot:TRINITY_DN3426_c0_g1_i5.p1 TRINITY_DN3426_c0_g1~~TRINITY_DN3426_c0_g1_i5.p1  ORF type:complete len:161 (+),score=32.24 TRINITY_DN3426_c0_g1_i5:375-857(+)